MRSATQPTVSVVIPLHDHAATIAPAVRSALSQTAADDGVHMEVVVVDDASTDGGADLLVELPVTLVGRTERGGAAAARNQGWRHCTGDYLIFLDSDDLMPPNRVRRQLAALRSDPQLGAVGGLLEEFADEGYMPQRALRGPTQTAMVGALLLPRSTFERVGGFDETIGRREVVDWGARLRRSGLPVAALDEVVLRRRMHAGNHGNDGAHIHPLLTVVRRHLTDRASDGHAPRDS